MSRHLRLGPWWRIAIAVVLVLSISIRTIPAASAAGSVVVVVTDAAGTPLAGAEVALFAAVADAGDGTGGGDDGTLVPGTAPLVTPALTGADGVATFNGVPQDVPLFAVQTAAPAGYEPVTGPVSLTVAADVGAPIQVALVAQPAAGVVEAIVVDADGGAPVAGTTFTVFTLPDPATGLRGATVVEATTGNAGIAHFDLSVGSYIVALTGAPAGYLAPGPAADQPVAVAASAGGQRDYHVLFFELQPGSPPPPIPTSELALPVETVAAGPVTETLPADPPSPTPAPAEPDLPTSAPEVASVTLTITGLVCANAFQFNRTAYYADPGVASFDPAVGEPAAGCRFAAAGEVTFLALDPRGDGRADDVEVGRAITADDGRAIIQVPGEAAGRVLAVGQAERTSRSDAFPVMPGDGVSIIAVNYVLPAFGNVVVRTRDAETAAAVAGGCLALVSADPSVAPFETCDEDDGSTDGRTRFINVPNGTYAVRQTMAAPGYAPAAGRTVAVAGRSVEIPATADALGAIELWAVSCAGRDEPAELVVGEPVRLAAGGDGTGVGPVAPTPVADGCDGVAAEMVIVPAGSTGPAAAMTVRTGDDGRAVAVPLVPSDGVGGAIGTHRVELPDGSLVAEVTVAPGAVTIVTLLLPGDAA